MNGICNTHMGDEARLGVQGYPCLQGIQYQTGQHGAVRQNRIKWFKWNKDMIREKKDHEFSCALSLTKQ